MAGHGLTFIAVPIKVALGIGNLALGTYCLPVTQANHCRTRERGKNASVVLLSCAL